MPSATAARIATPAVLPPPQPAPGVPGDSPAIASGWDPRPLHHLTTTIAETPRDLISDPGTAELEWAPAGQDLRDVALQLRLLLSRGTSLAIATVVGARGAVIRRPGTVLVVTEAGQTIGFNPAGPLDRAIRDLASQALATGQSTLQHLRIDQDAAGYIGLSGQISLDVHAMRMDAADPAFGAMLRYLDSSAATVLIIGTCGAAGYAVVGADHAVRQPGRPSMPSPVIQDARSMLGSRHTVSRTYRPSGGKPGTGIRVWMASYPQA